MIHKWQVVDNLLGSRIVDALVATLYNQVSDFPETHQNYLSAIDKLKKELGEDNQNHVRKLVAAIDMKCSGQLYYFGLQGLKMNCDHFFNPMTPNCTWPQIDYDDFIRTEIACELPLYRHGEKFINKFRIQLGEGHDDLWDAVLSYETALEVCGSKLAHFYGYLAGNQLLCHCIPCYQADPGLTLRYEYMLEKYFGTPINTNQWEGGFDPKTWKSAPDEIISPEDAFCLREAIWKETLY